MVVLLLPCFKEIPYFNANSVDADHTPCFVLSDQGLYCLRVSLLADARHKCVLNIHNTKYIGLAMQKDV